jgi:hypothetical protein
MRLFSRHSFAWFSLVALAGGVACSAPPVPEEEAEETSEPDETDTSEPTNSTTKPGSVTPKPSGSNPPSPPPVTPEPTLPVPEDHVPMFDPDYPGIDIALPGTKAPKGCSDGYDPDTDIVTITLNATVPAVRLHVKDGVLHANDVACEDDAGDALPVEGLVQVVVKGGNEVNLVIVDFAEEGFGESLFAAEGGFRFDAGQGDDALYFRGSDGDDEFYAGAANSRFVAAFSSVARVNLFAKSFETLRSSLGPGNDAWREIGRLNVGLFDLDSGSVLRIEGIDLPQRLWGGDGDDELNGGAFDDQILGGSGDDLVNGMDGNDGFDEGSKANGKDVINGGPGLDDVSYDLRVNDLFVELCESDALAGCSDACPCDASGGEADEGDTLINVEQLRAGGGNDVIVGGLADNFIYAGDGDDQITGGGGSDVLQGQDGADELDGGDDEDICDADMDEVVNSCEV